MATTIEQFSKASDALLKQCMAAAQTSVDKLTCAYYRWVDGIHAQRIGCDGAALNGVDRLVCATDEQTALTQAANEQRANLARLGVSQ